MHTPTYTETCREDARKNLSGPVGVFDSGIGGLTVAAAIRSILPDEDIFYIGDTARVPYGGKSRSTIERYSIEICGLLLAEGAKAIVIACNTASALALDRLRGLFRAPILGVVEPGARAAAQSTKTGKIGVIATRATVGSGAYERAIRKISPDIEVRSVACPLLVPLIEEGMLDDPITDMAVARYLGPLLDAGIDTLVLGCTHYPLLKKAFNRFAPGLTLVDSAENCARALAALIEENNLRTPVPDKSGRLRVALTDSPGPFLRVAAEGLDLPLAETELRSVQQPAFPV